MTSLPNRARSRPNCILFQYLNRSWFCSSIHPFTKLPTYQFPWRPGFKSAILVFPAILAISSCGPLPASLSQTPTPHTTFVANKGQTPIRKDCRKPVDPSFLRFFDLESRCISLVFATCHPLLLISIFVATNDQRIAPNHSAIKDECTANFTLVKLTRRPRSLGYSSEHKDWIKPAAPGLGYIWMVNNNPAG